MALDNWRESRYNGYMPQGHKSSTTFRLTPEALTLLKALAADLGISQAGVIEMIIRKAARKEKIEIKKEDK